MYSELSVAIVGGCCGKSELINRFINDTYTQEYNPTGVEEFHYATIDLDDSEINVKITDTGSEYDESTAERWFQEPDGFVLCYSVGSVYTFDQLFKIREDILRIKGEKKIPIVLVATQNDLTDNERQVLTDEGRSWAVKYRVPFMETSAVTGERINLAFETVAREVFAFEMRRMQDEDVKYVQSGRGKARAKYAALAIRKGKEIKKGILLKQGRSMKKGFKKRVCILQEGLFSYYKSEKEVQKGNPLNSITLLTSTVKPVAKDRFMIMCVQKEYIFQTTTPYELASWMEAIQNEILRSLNQNMSTKSQVGSIGVESGSESGQAAFKTLRIDEGNRICVDCGAPDPDWASINTGILCCIQCSGIHRSLGTDYSKVRSLTLDEWNIRLLNMMEAIGNNFANTVWEANIPSEVSKPQGQSPRAEKEEWISMKYRESKFLQRDIKDEEKEFGKIEDEIEESHKEVATDMKRLLSACKRDDIHSAYKILVQKYAWSSNGEHGTEALFCCSKYSSFKVGMLLMNTGTSPVRTRRNNNTTAKEYALSYGNEDFAKFLNDFSEPEKKNLAALRKRGFSVDIENFNLDDMESYLLSSVEKTMKKDLSLDIKMPEKTVEESKPEENKAKKPPEAQAGLPELPMTPEFEIPPLPEFAPAEISESDTPEEKKIQVEEPPPVDVEEKTNVKAEAKVEEVENSSESESESESSDEDSTDSDDESDADSESDSGEDIVESQEIIQKPEEPVSTTESVKGGEEKKEIIEEDIVLLKAITAFKEKQKRDLDAFIKKQEVEFKRFLFFQKKKPQQKRKQAKVIVKKVKKRIVKEGAKREGQVPVKHKKVVTSVKKKKVARKEGSVTKSAQGRPVKKVLRKTKTRPKSASLNIRIEHP